MYIKVIYNDNVIDVLSSITYVKYIASNNLAVSTDVRSESFGILSSDNREIYHIESLPNNAPNNSYKTVSLEEISEEEFLNLKELLDEVPEDTTDIEDSSNTDSSQIVIPRSLDSVITKKLKQLSSDCNSSIISGFEVELTDGNIYHFDLTIEDQVNLLSLTVLASQGTKEIPYHASDELCKFYSPEDIALIVNKASEVKTYHTTYYNALKNYVRSLNSIEEVEAVKYGDKVPDEYQTEVMKSILEES